MIEAWLQSLPSDEAAIQILEEHRVPTAPVLSVPQAMNHPHLRQRGTVITVKDPFMEASKFLPRRCASRNSANSIWWLHPSESITPKS